MSTTPKPIYEDPVHIDSRHYQVEFESDRVRVIRVKYGPHEKSPMHGHPESVAVFLTANRGQFNFPNGSSEVREWKAGQVMAIPGEIHAPENLSDGPLELVLIEVKG